MERIGLLAGGRQFPLLLARSAGKRGIPVYAVAHEGETDPALGDLADEIIWVKFGQAQRIFDFFHQHGVTDICMAGSINKENIWQNAAPDERALAVASRLENWNDDLALRVLSEEFESEGLHIRPSTLLAPDLFAPEGVLTRRQPSEEEERDAEFGWRIAKEIGRLDIGQSVVIRNRVVLAVEAIDGTDATIRRGGTLGKENTVVVKVVKPDQDLRFDLPSIGLETISTMSEVKASALVIEAGKTLMFDREAMIESADRAGITIWSRGGTDD